MLQKSGLLTYDIKKLVVHYPPVINPVGNAFQFWIPNKVDRARIEALKRIVKEMKISYGFIYFGHIHLGAGDPMLAYPNIMGFELDDNNYGLWVKPGSVVRISD